MKVTPDSSVDEILTWARSVQTLLANRSDSDTVRAVDEAIKQYESNRFILTVLGKTKRGKSTLVNALLGRRDDALAPISKMPASSVITRFFRSHEEKALVFHRDGRQTSIRYSDVRDYVTEDRNPRNINEVTAVEIRGPFPNLAPDLVLLDTPGSGSIHIHHDALLQASIPQSDAVIFMVTAGSPLDQDEVELLTALKKADIQKVFFVINMVDVSEEHEIQEGVEHNLKVLGKLAITDDRSFYRVSALKAFQGDLAASGVPDLLEDLEAFLKTSKGRLLNQRFIERVRGKIMPLRQRLAVEIGSASKSTTQLDADLQAIRRKKEELRDERDFAGREFAITWTRAVDQFARDVSECKAAVNADVRGAITDASMKGLPAFAKNLPSLIAQRVETRLQEPAARMESLLKQGCERLELAFPAIDINDAGAVNIRTKTGHTLLVGGATGTAIGAAGIGIVAAGSAAAASIAAANAAAAAALATAGGLSIPALVGAGLTWAGGFFGGPVGAILGALGAGSAAPAASVSLLATPAWVALAGPIGWTIAGIGAVTIPFAWRISKVKQKEKLEQASIEEVDRIILHIEKDRVSALRQMALSIIDEFNTKLDRQLADVERTLMKMIENRPRPETILALETFRDSLDETLANGVPKAGAV